MPTRLALRVLALLLALSLLPLAFVHATHSPTTAQVVAAAEQLGMKCTPSAAQVDCEGPSYSAVRFPHTTIRPASGALVDVFTRVDAHSNGAHELFFDDQVWMTEVHSVGCANKNGVSQFLADLDATFRNADTGGTLGRTVGECQLTGTFEFPSRVSCPRVPCYSVTSTILPGAFPTPTPPPPTPPPVVTPTPTPSPTPTASPTPTPSPTPTASPTPTPRPSATPEQTVAGITFAPQPSLPPPDITNDPTGWAASVHDPADVSTDPAAMGVSALLAALLLLFMGFVGELFNNTVKAHYDEISGWWKKGFLGRLAAAWSAIWKAGP